MVLDVIEKFEFFVNVFVWFLWSCFFEVCFCDCVLCKICEFLLVIFFIKFVFFLMFFIVLFLMDGGSLLVVILDEEVNIIMVIMVNL